MSDRGELRILWGKPLVHKKRRKSDVITYGVTRDIAQAKVWAGVLNANNKIAAVSRREPSSAYPRSGNLYVVTYQERRRRKAA